MSSGGIFILGKGGSPILAYGVKPTWPQGASAPGFSKDRHGRKSIIVTSQLPELDWYDAIGDTTVADAILDRIVHTAHRITLTGESVRKLKAFKGR